MKKIIISLILIFGVLSVINVYGEEKCEFKYMSYKDFLKIDNEENYINIINKQYIENQKKYKDKIYIEEKNGKYFIINNGKKSEGYNYIVKLMISFDGKNIAYIVREDGKEYIIYNGKKSKKYSKISLNHLKFSLNGDFVFLGIKDDGSSILVKNLKEISKNTFSPRFSYNSKQFGYIKKENGKQIAIVNGKKSKFYGKVRVEITLKDKIVYKNGEEYFYLNCNNLFLNKDINKSKIQLTKQLIISRSKLKKNIKYGKSVSKFKKLIPKVPNNKLLEIDKKIEKLSEKTRNNIKYKDILNYLEAKIKLEILKRGL